ncbi:probable uroporphyrin-III c-methyltransferase [Sporolactobacillus inulinus]|uniref:Probable uroporphyrin-III c-methyltransferase n=1 Tax=Sporolactobacillus inulinus TaxID=2078 RepID=A0A4Y1ZAW8_9BACL|nr:probable uroporphyrin-III c-methyltransferase [Sporolactobacillus inulinus]
MKRKIKRIYESVQDDDGLRVLIDRLWPRGVSKAKAQLDEWMKNVAPSPELRTQFNHKPERFAALRKHTGANCLRMRRNSRPCASCLTGTARKM